MTIQFSILGCVFRFILWGLLAAALTSTCQADEQLPDEAMESLLALITELRASADQESATRLDQLAATVRQHQYGDYTGYKKMAQVAGWLSADDRYGELLELIDQRYRRPNLKLVASENLLNTLVASESLSQEPFRERILGATYSGRNTIDSTLRLRTNPAENRISLAIVLDSNVQTRSSSSQQRIVVNSQGTTHISAAKQVSWSANGWHLSPTIARASTNSQTTCITVRRLIGRRIARRQVYEQRGAVQRASADRTAFRTRERMDREFAAEFNAWQQQFDRDIRLPLIERDLLPRFVRRQSTSDSAELTLLQANRREFAATGAFPAPRIRQSTPDLSLCIHQSAWNNFSTGMFAGEEVRDEELAETISELFGSTPAGLKPSDDEKSWSIQFDETDPLAVQFEEDCVVVTIRALGFNVGETSIPSTRLKIKYQLSVVDSRLKGVRQGSIQIAPLDQGTDAQVGVRYQMFRSLLRQRFDRLFPTETVWDGMRFPGVLGERANLAFKYFGTNDEWLQLEFHLPLDEQQVNIARQ